MSDEFCGFLNRKPPSRPLLNMGGLSVWFGHIPDLYECSRSFCIKILAGLSGLEHRSERLGNKDPQQAQNASEFLVPFVFGCGEDSATRLVERIFVLKMVCLSSSFPSVSGFFRFVSSVFSVLGHEKFIHQAVIPLQSVIFLHQLAGNRK